MPLSVSNSLCWLAIYLFPLYALVVWVGFSWRDLSYIINVVANVLSTTYVKWKLGLPHHTSCIPQKPKQMISILFPSFSLSTCQVLERSSNQHWLCVYQLLSDHCHLFKSEAMLTKCREHELRRGKGHEEGGSAYAKVGSSLRSPPGNSRASTPKTCFVLSPTPLTLRGLSPTTSLWKKS